MTQKVRKNIFDILGRNPVHPFPARMAPGIAMEALSQMNGSVKVLDPMMGSGTVLALARSRGHKAIGFDIDPLAVLISKAWIESRDTAAVRQIATEVLASAKEIAKHASETEAYPHAADEETRAFIDYWFDAGARQQLTALSAQIAAVESVPARNALWCALSRLIITKQLGVSLAMDLSHSRPHRVCDCAPVRPFDRFLLAVDKVLENTVEADAVATGPEPALKVGDARKLPLKNSSIDLVITSPPYLNAIDYIRCSKFSLVWMGYTIRELRKLRAESVGSEISKGAPIDDPEIKDVISSLRVRTKLSAKNHGMLGRYIDDMRSSIRETSRVLRPGGAVIYVVGENSIRDTYIRTAVIIRKLAANTGLVLVESSKRALPANRRYLPPPTVKNGSMDSRMRHEVVLTFSK